MNGWFNKESRKFVCFLDTSFIVGTIFKSIEKDTWKIRIKIDKCIEELNNSNCLLLINDLVVYEIKKNLIKDFTVHKWKVDEIYSLALSSFKNVKYFPTGEVKINQALVNWMIKHDLDFVDGLLINIAQRLEIPLVSSERKALEWKKIYSGVMTQDEFWNELRKK